MKQQTKKKARGQAHRGGRPARAGRAAGGAGAKRGKKRAASRGHTQAAITAPGTGGTAVAGTAPPRFGLPRKVSTLVRAIFRTTDPVQVATGLLKGNHTTAGKLYLQLLEYFYGKPAPQFETRGPEGGEVRYQFVSNIPRPQYPASFTAPGPPAASASGAPPASLLPSRANGPDSTQEEEHE